MCITTQAFTYTTTFGIMASNTYHPGQLLQEKDHQPSSGGLGALGEADGVMDLTSSGLVNDVFGEEENHDVKYKTLTWQLVAVMMITEIVSNGMLTLPSSLDAVGIVPGVIVIAFLGAFATFTSWVLIEFKLRHPEGRCLPNYNIVPLRRPTSSG